DTARATGIAALAERERAVRVRAATAPSAAEDARAKAWLKQAMQRGAGAELSLAEQLGLKFRRVIIDAGHGGHDTGAIGAKGTQEKDVALAIALDVAKELKAQGLEVLLTRDDDTFVKLEDRAKFANAHQGDLFVSIHCNSAPTKTLRGVETYSLNTSADRYAIRLSARENATTERGVGDLRFILADLATKANTGESQRLAQSVQRSVIGKLQAEHPGVRDLGTKEALFYVLLGAKMPAILVETSFLSHPEEEKLLGTPAYQHEVAGAVARGVQDFLDAREAKMASRE
ncbi:MAG: N-acetylmuramoyl-L-alanine amidase, partial [Myxococcaceae bacterium]|nr:N-acetylmuramoyl-L-alanine amidase [Myxococcaceae bacterium]